MTTIEWLLLVIFGADLAAYAFLAWRLRSVESDVRDLRDVCTALRQTMGLSPHAVSMLNAAARRRMGAGR